MQQYIHMEQILSVDCLNLRMLHIYVIICHDIILKAQSTIVQLVGYKDVDEDNSVNSNVGSLQLEHQPQVMNVYPC